MWKFVTGAKIKISKKRLPKGVRAPYLKRANFSIWVKENFRSSLGQLCYNFRSSVIVFGRKEPAAKKSNKDCQDIYFWE
jgi:hypothetical protein